MAEKANKEVDSDSHGHMVCVGGGQTEQGCVKMVQPLGSGVWHLMVHSYLQQPMAE